MKKHLTLFIILISCLKATAQDGALDTSFTAVEDLFLTYTIVPDNNGNVYIGGGLNEGKVRRLFANGNNDSNFGFNSLGQITNLDGWSGISIRTMHLQNDNNLLIGGRFEYLGRECLVRVNSQGVIDSGFNFQTPGETNSQGVTDGDFEVRDIAIQPTANGDKILLVGRSLTDDPRIYRINYTTGAVDNTFNTNGANGTINSIAVLPNGDIIVVGEFTTYNGYSRNKIARLDANGNVQSSYNYTGALGNLYSVKLDNNNKILIGGVNTFKRLNSDLTVDSSFTSSVTGEIKFIDLFADGNIIVGGHWTNINGTTISSQLAKMNDTGTLNSCFTDYSIYNENSEVFSMCVYGDAVFVGGALQGSYQGVPNDGTIKIKGNTVTINAVDDIGNTVYSNNGGVAVTNVLGGNTPDTVNNVNATLSNVTLTQVSTTNPGVTLNTSNGSVNVAPNTPSGTYTLVYKICMQGSTCNCDEAEVTVTVSETLATINAHSKSIVLNSTENTSISIGSYNNTSATSQNVSIEFLTPLPPGFSLDSLGANVDIDPFTPMGTYSYQVKICDLNAPNNCDTATVNIAITTEALSPININNTVKISGYQSDQKPIIIGDFTSPGNKIARLDHALNMDYSFNHQGPSPATAVPKDMKILNNLIVVVGGFNGFNGGSNGKGIAMLYMSTGNVYNFNLGGTGVAGGTAEIYCVDSYSSYLFIAGSFTSFNGIPINSIAKISNSTGAVDTSFNPGSGFGGGVPYDIITTPGGYVIAVGNFTSYKGTPVNKIVRIKPNGDLDTSFSASITGNYVEDIISIPSTGGSGGYFITGDFSLCNGVSRKNIARIDLNGNLVTSFNPGSGFNDVVRSIAYKESVYPFEPSSFNGFYQVGTIYVGGDFTIYNGQPVKKVVRLNLYGQIEQSFQDGVGFGPSLSKVYTLSVQPDNLLLIAGGQFTSYNTYPINNLVRLEGCTNYFDVAYPGVGIGRPLPSEGSDITNEIETQLLPENFISEKNISIYPNPSNGIFNLQIDGYSGEDFEIEVFNPLGQVIFKSNISGQSTYQMDLSTMEAGNYFVRIQNNNTLINKIIVKK